MIINKHLFLQEKLNVRCCTSKFVKLLDTGYRSISTVSTETRKLLRISKEISNLMEPPLLEKLVVAKWSEFSPYFSKHK